MERVQKGWDIGMDEVVTVVVVVDDPGDIEIIRQGTVNIDSVKEIL